MRWRKNNLGIPTIVGSIVILMTAGVLPGEVIPKKELAFSQLAAGPNIQSTLTVANRGVENYIGTVHFWRGQDQDWNPIVNGEKISGSSMEIILPPGATRVYRVEDVTLVTGAVRIECEDFSIHSFIDGNLTYTIGGQEFESVGVTSSTGFYRSVLSFHDFSAVGLALANPDIQKNTMVTLILYDDTGLEIERSTRTLLGRSHEARFLAEIFDAHVSVGTVELESNVSIFASAFNLVEGEISVLEIRSSPVRYTLEVDDDMESDQAELLLWAEDVFVHGYLRFLMIDNEPIQDPQTYMVTGTLVDNTLRLTQMGLGGVNNDEIVSSLRLEGFSFDGSAWNGTYSRTSHGFPFDHLISGPFYMKREN